MAEADRRRRRVRQVPGSARGTGPPTPSATTTRVHDEGPEAVPPPPPRRGGPGAEERDGERGLRGLVGSGSSQVSIRAAMRARDAARPTEQELTEAESRVVIVRRNWTPREDLPRSPR